MLSVPSIPRVHLWSTWIWCSTHAASARAVICLIAAISSIALSFVYLIKFPSPVIDHTLTLPVFFHGTMFKVYRALFPIKYGRKYCSHKKVTVLLYLCYWGKGFTVPASFHVYS